MHTNAFVLAMMVVQLSKKFIEIILVGDPAVLKKKQKENVCIYITYDNFCFSGTIKVYMNILIS